jgi:uncharacterized protein (TIGR03067 family)
MRRFALAIVLSSAALVAASPPPRDKAPQGDLAKIQGRWQTSAGPKHDIPVVVEFRGDRVTVDLTTPQGLKIRAEGKVKLDEKARPRALDWVEFTALDGQDMPEVLAIYEFDGETLKVCNGGPNNARPTEFKAGEGALADVVVFRRPKSADRDGKVDEAVASTPRSR